MYQSSTFPVNNNEEYSFNFGPYLRHSTTSTLQLTASGINHDGSSAMREMSVSAT
jgi:hypothetical protein